MAVIREKRQYLSQPIGVVKAQVGDVEGARSIGQFADTLIEGSFKTLIEDAQQAGKESGLSATSQQIRTINPETGQPEAFTIPPQFGRAASRAYQQVVERRYVSEVEQDLKTESAKIFAEEMLKPDGYGNYSKRMRQYAQDITDSALPRFKNIVTGLSSSLIASTEVDFIKRDAQRDLEASLLGLQEDADSNASTLTNAAAILDFGNEGQIEDLVGTFDGFLEAQRTGLTAGVHNSTTFSDVENNIAKSIGIGIARNIGSVYEQSLSTTNPLDPSDLVTLQQVMRTGVGKESLDPRLKKFVGVADQFNIQLGEDGKETPRNYSGLVKGSVFSELSSIHSNAVRIKAATDSTASEEQKDASYNWISNMLNPESETGFNGLVQSINSKVESGNWEGAISDFKANESRIRAEGQKLEIPIDTLENGIMRYRKGVSNALLSVIFGSPINTKDNKGRDVTRPLLPNESSNVEKYLSNSPMGVTLQDIPKEIRSIVKQAKDLQTTRTEDDFYRDVEAANQEIQSFYADKKTQADNIQLGTAALNGGSTSSKKSREAVDFVTIGNNADTPLYFLTDEGYDAFNVLAPKFAKTGFVGQNLVDTFEVIAGGRQELSDDQINRAFDIWRRLEFRSDATGGMFNVWSNSSLSENTFKMMTSISSVVKDLKGGKNASDVYRDMRFLLSPENKEAFGDQMSFGLGNKTLDNFVSDIVGESNFEAREYFEGIVPYLVATKATPERIEETINTMFDEHFVETEGYVINNGEGQPFKSAFSLAKYMDKTDRITAIRNLNEYLAQTGAKARISRRELTATENFGFFFTGFLGTTLQELDILDRGDSTVQSKDDQEVYLMPIAGESLGTGEDIIYQLVYLENGTVQSYKHPELDEFIYVNLLDLKASVAPPTDYTNDDWLFMEYQRQQQIEQGTSNPFLEDDMSTIGLNPEMSVGGFSQFMQEKRK